MQKRVKYEDMQTQCSISEARFRQRFGSSNALGSLMFPKP